MKKVQMMIVTTILFLCTTLTACTVVQTQKTPELDAADIPQVGMPNPASVYCEQQGNILEIHTADDGSQTGVCVFPDGSTCDEWAYFRGECGMKSQVNPKLNQTTEPTSNGSGGYLQPGTSEPIEDWWGVIKSTAPGAQYDDYFERQDMGGPINFGIDSLDPEVEAQIHALRDSGKIVHFYGSLLSNVPDFNGSQILVERIEVEE